MAKSGDITDKADTRLDQLAAMQEIRTLVYQYAYALDSRDYALMESLWVDTPEPADPPTLDIHVMRQLPEIIEGLHTSTLFVGNHLITIDDPDHARGSVYCMAFIDWGDFIDQSIVYQDVYERHNGKWLFRTRDHLLMWGQARKSNPMKLPAANWPTSQVGAGNGFEVIRCDVPATDPALPKPYRVKK